MHTYINSLLLTFTTGVCFEIPSRFEETSYLIFIVVQQTGCHMITNSFTPTRVFFEYVSCKLFRLYLLILIGF